jgi:pSer/pThr/pTyr-binding forkhead associated (FHA) protein
MVQFEVLTGAQAGTICPLWQFPAHIGRARAAALTLNDAGVWDQHLTIECDGGEGFSAALQPDALATINGQPFTRQRLRNGDVLELGAVKLRFWIAASTQHGLRWREAALWLGLLSFLALQAGLLWLLPP